MFASRAISRRARSYAASNGMNQTAGKEANARGGGGGLRATRIYRVIAQRRRGDGAVTASCAGTLMILIVI